MPISEIEKGIPASPGEDADGLRAYYTAQFASFIADPTFPCLAAKAAMNADSYSLSVYAELGTPASAAALSKDLETFTSSQMRLTNEFATFVAVFQAPKLSDEEEFERLLWQQLQQLRDIDGVKHPWDPTVSSDPNDVHFSFSFSGVALYVVGLHPNSSRLSRRFPQPALIFNPHEQFERLRQSGRWNRMRDTIRSRDAALQGTANPMLNDFGDTSEARQYSGRVVGNDWRAPFRDQHNIPSGKCPFAAKAQKDQ